jgi:hypothetical protein
MFRSFVSTVSRKREAVLLSFMSIKLQSKAGRGRNPFRRGAHLLLGKPGTVVHGPSEGGSKVRRGLRCRLRHGQCSCFLGIHGDQKAAVTVLRRIDRRSPVSQGEARRARRFSRQELQDSGIVEQWMVSVRPRSFQSCIKNSNQAWPTAPWPRTIWRTLWVSCTSQWPCLCQQGFDVVGEPSVGEIIPVQVRPKRCRYRRDGRNIRNRV